MRSEKIQSLARDERLARQVGYWWGLAEGVFFFIIPDVYISLATLFSLRAGALAWLFSIGGSLTAVIVIGLLIGMPGLDYASFLDSIPGISRTMIERVESSLAAGGLPYTPLLALGGVPLKVYAAAAFSRDLSLGAVLIWTAFARIVRIAPTFLVAAVIRLLFGRRIDAHPITWSGLLGFFWLGFYILYFLRMSSG